MEERERSDLSLNRRDWLKAALGGTAGLALGGLLDVPAVKAASREFKLANVSEFTTSCNFCSCGCGMIAAVRDGKLLKMEGDYDHIVNRGSLCVKGISMYATHASPQRLTTPRYRAAGSDKWQEISWDEMLDKLAQRIKESRDATFVTTDAKGNTVNRCEGVAFAGGAAFSSEEGYLAAKLMRTLGVVHIEQQARV